MLLTNFLFPKMQKQVLPSCANRVIRGMNIPSIN